METVQLVEEFEFGWNDELNGDYGNRGEVIDEDEDEEWGESTPVIINTSPDRDIKKWIDMDILEVRSALHYWASILNSKYENYFILYVAIRTKSLNLPHTQQRMLGITNPFLVVEFKFQNGTYWTDIPPEIESILQCPTTPENTPDLLHRTSFALSWASRHRFRMWCKSHVYAYGRSKYPIDADEVSSVMEASQQSFNHVMSALKLSKYSSYEAIVQLSRKQGIQCGSGAFVSTNIYFKLMEMFSAYVQQSHLTCLVCDTPLENAGIKPSVCDKDLCCHVFETLGLGFDFNTEIIRDAPVLDLYVTLFVAASRKKRLSFIQPYSDETKLTEEEMCDILSSYCPSILHLRELAMQGVHISKVLSDIHPHLHSIMRWFIISSRSYLRSLEPDEQWKHMDTPHQFVLLTDTPERESGFQSLKTKEKTVFYAFHGSDTGNWFSILRTGLKNLSNTKYMTTGCLYGPGVYLAETSKTSESYATMSEGWEHSMFGGQMRCVALCEVIGRPVDRSGTGIYVIPDDSRISTRYFFIYPKESSIPPVCAQSLFKIKESQ